MTISIYFAADDVEVSAVGVFAAPVVHSLYFEPNPEEKEVRLYALADDGLVVTDTTIQPISGNGAASTDMWQLAPDAAGSPGTYEDPGDPLVLGVVGDTTEVFFWAKALSELADVVGNDDTVVLQLTGTGASE
jgi:hypothetical protein